jgi:hypothetical protein
LWLFVDQLLSWLLSFSRGSGCGGCVVVNCRCGDGVY